jgi:formate/nitrite transporter FocA (FNT family)
VRNRLQLAHLPRCLDGPRCSPDYRIDIFAIFFPIMAFVAIGFEHSVANMYFTPTGIMLMDGAGFMNIPGVDPNMLDWVNLLWRNLLPVTIGNIIGGAVFVGMSYWGAYLRPIKADS